MPTISDGGNKRHKNEEKTVRCPAEGCEREVLSRGLHLHVRNTDGKGHGEAGTIPDELDLDAAETVGTKEVEMEYPEKRTPSEDVIRLCPYCQKPFRGKQNVMIHLGQVAGRKNHPEDAPDRHDLNDFAIVHLDENDNVIETVKEGPELPSTQQREGGGGVDPEKVREQIEELREQGLDEQADKMERMLLGE